MEADFSGGHLSGEGGALLFREMDRRPRLRAKLAECFEDRRDDRHVGHQPDVLVRQRVRGLALGDEDRNDHERLRIDPLLEAACGGADLLGELRRREED